MDWGGYVHPTYFRIDFLIRLNSMKKVGGGSIFPSERLLLVPLAYNSMIRFFIDSMIRPSAESGS